MQEDSAGAAEDGGGAGAPLTVQPRGQDEGAPLDQLGYQPPARPCVLILGQEVPAEAAGSCTQALISELVSELSGEGREIAGDTLAAIAQQYEDDKSFGPNSLRALTERFYASGRQCPSEVHRRLQATGQSNSNDVLRRPPVKRFARCWQEAAYPALSPAWR